MSKKFILISIISALVIAGSGLLFYKFISIPQNFPEEHKKELSENDKFRNSAIRFVREVAENSFDGDSTKYPEELEIKGDWQIDITLYFQGEIKGEGSSNDEILSLALEEATKNTLKDKRYEELIKEDIKTANFLVTLSNSSGQPFSFIEYNGEGREVVNDLIIIRNLDKDLIREEIKQGKEFLFNIAQNKEEYGFYKKYDVLTDSFENRLHTVYSASIIYTFLYIYDYDKDEKILEHMSDWADFLLSMQNKDKEDKRYGAFHYSYYLDTKEKEKRFVVGTSALSIFTLLRLYDLTGDSKYLESAKLAGNWLTTMQRADGVIKPYTRYSDDGKWVYGKKESLLYEGQVLSSLSKLYKATGQQKYYDTAEKIAQRFVQKYEKEGGNYVEGEYRKKNPISNAWVVMSLMDFYEAKENEYYKSIIFDLSDKILRNQINDINDPLNHGRWKGAYSTSGIGWISEVSGDVYRFCKEQSEGAPDCNKYKNAVVGAIRWLIQNTYSEENTFFLKNSEKAIGGLFWNEKNKYVRTDSVCHALNGYTRIINELRDGLLISIPEKSLKEILPY